MRQDREYLEDEFRAAFKYVFPSYKINAIYIQEHNQCIGVLPVSGVSLSDLTEIPWNILWSPYKTD